MKLGVIADGISRDLSYALDIIDESGLDHVELQFVGDKEVGDFNDDEIIEIKDLVSSHLTDVSCISRHIFGGLSLMATSKDDPNYLGHLDALKRCIDLAKKLSCPLVRIMSFRKEMILFGSQGADQWNVSRGAWDRLLHLMEAPLQMAEDEDITLVVETGNNAMITSAWLARKLIDTLGTKHLKLLWDPCNSLYCNEPAYPDGYDAIGVDLIGHIHIKDSLIDIPKATVICTALKEGDMAPYLNDLAQALKRDRYQGTISLESVYRPDNGSFEDGFRASLPVFKEIFNSH